MAKPYLILKMKSGIFYARILLPNGQYSTNKSTGTRNREEADRIVMEWVVKKSIPTRINSKEPAVASTDKISLLYALKTLDLTSEDAKTITDILLEKKLLRSVVIAESKESRDIETFLLDFWDYDKSPYVKEKLRRGQSIHRDYCMTLQSRIKRYWLPHLKGKCVGEITRDDITTIFDDGEVSKLANKTINSIVCALTIPMKWAYLHNLTQNNCYEGIMKCTANSKKRKVLTLEEAHDVFTALWENDSAKLANELAFFTGMRQGEIAALRRQDIGIDRIYIRHSWSKYEGLKCCKNGEEREIKIPSLLRDDLLKLADMNPHNEGKNGFIFFGLNPSHPTDPKNWLKYLHRALESIGFENPKDICFHSWRHLWCSRVSDLIRDKRVVMAGSGHKTEVMLDHYAEHLENEAALEKLLNAQEALFLPVIKDAENNTPSVLKAASNF